MTNENNNNQVVNIDAQSMQGAVKMNEKDMNSKLNQAGQNVHPEAKTVVNGKMVPLQDALQAEQSLNQQAKQTGITEAHNNHTEAVQAGEVAQNAQGLQQNQEVQNIKQANVQSGQAELEKHIKSSVSGYNIESNQEPTKAPKAKAKNQEGQ
jgi:hypothetical protein